MNTMHLFAGGGGGMFADLILGHTPVVAVELDGACCEALRARKENRWWPECEIIEEDVRAFSGMRYAGKVDCIHAGFPCQDVSHANPQNSGLDGDRSSLYSEAFRIVREIRPKYVFLENVSGIFSADIGRVFGDLAALGYDIIRWTCTRTSDVGGPHERLRWWCLAERRQTISHTDHTRCKKQWKPKPSTKEHTTIEFCDWWETEPDVDRVVHGMARNGNFIKMMGNGQVPIQAAMSWIKLGGPYFAQTV